LMNYHWPGNVRELENCLERATILCTDGVIHGYMLPPNLQRSDSNERGESSGPFKATMTGMEREILTEELKRSRGNLARAARELGITERMIGLRVAKYGIKAGQFK
jgi:Nif-specific regulatory protein